MQLFKLFKYNEREKAWGCDSRHWFSLDQIRDWIKEHENEPEKVVIVEFENTTFVAKCNATKILNLNLLDLPYSLKDFNGSSFNPKYNEY